MYLAMPYMQKNVLFHRKTYSNCLEGSEINHRNYLILLSHFSDNLNTSISNLEDCISDLEEHPKFKISRSERQLLERGLQYLCDLYLDRVCKESYYRNAVIRKNYNLFLQSYSVFLSKNKGQWVSRNKEYSVKSNKQNQRRRQRSVFNKQSCRKINTIDQRRQIKNSMLFGRTILYQQRFTTNQEKHHFQGSKIFTAKRASIISNYSRKLTISPTDESKQSDWDVKGDLVFVNYPTCKDQQFDYELQKSIKKPVQSLSTNRVLAFRNRISTNPQHHEKQKGTKYGPMLRMSYMNIQDNRGPRKSKLPYQQQIKLILNIDD